MRLVELIRGHAQALPELAKFAIGLAIIVCVPRLAPRVRLPGVVGLLLVGIVVGPYCLDLLAREEHEKKLSKFGKKIGYGRVFCRRVGDTPAIKPDLPKPTNPTN